MQESNDRMRARLDIILDRVNDIATDVELIKSARELEEKNNSRRIAGYSLVVSVALTAFVRFLEYLITHRP